jgi:hypothetical protein
LSEQELKMFIDLVQPFTSKIKAIGYVRAPKAYTESVFQQKLKTAPVQLGKPLIDISYKRLIGALDAVLGESNVEVYKYDRSALEGQCVVKDFCYHCGIDIQDKDVVSSNESLSQPAVQLLYMLWKYYPEFYRPRRSGIQTVLAKLLGRSLKSDVNQRIIANAVEHISQFPGMKMKLHSDAYLKMVNIDVGEHEWLEKRTGITFDEELHAHDNSGIRDEEDMMQIETETIRLLLEKLDMEPDGASRLGRNHRLLAEHIHMLANRPIGSTGFLS